MQKPMMASGIAYYWYFDIMVLELNKLDRHLVYALTIFFSLLPRASACRRPPTASCGMAKGKI